jgi:hypothetical protein
LEIDMKVFAITETAQQSARQAVACEREGR